MNIDEKLEKLKQIALDFGITPEQWEGFEPHLEQSIKQLIAEVEKEAYKKGYIDRGIEDITSEQYHTK